MDILLHWSVGFILGTLIVLPFIFGRWIYDYENHTWVQVCWGPVVDTSTARQLNIKDSELATPELHPITTSRFLFYHLLIANFCGFIALAPDLGQLWNAGSMDHGLWADFFFFHASIDSLSASTASTISGYAFIAAILVWLIVISLAMNAQNDNDCRESAVY